MAETPDVKEFLRLEDATAQLLTELTAVKRETVSFGDAHTTVAAAAQKLGVLSASLSETTGEIGGSARALREIGTPELMARQSKLESELRTVSKTLEEQQTRLDGLAAHISKSSDTSVSAFSRAHRLLQFIAGGVAVVIAIEIVAAILRH